MLDSSPETESIHESASLSGYAGQQMKSGTSVPTDSSKDVPSVSKSFSQDSLNSSKSFHIASNVQSVSASLPTTGTASSTEEQVLNDDSKDKKKKKRMPWFRLNKKATT